MKSLVMTFTFPLNLVVISTLKSHNTKTRGDLTVFYKNHENHFARLFGTTGTMSSVLIGGFNVLAVNKKLTFSGQNLVIILI